MSHRPRLAAYRTPEQIRARLVMLRDKRDRAHRYGLSIDAGCPNGNLLDTKQLAILADYRLTVGDRFPKRVFFSINTCIDILESRLKNLKRQRKRFLRERRFNVTDDARMLCGGCGTLLFTVTTATVDGQPPFFPDICWLCGFSTAATLMEDAA